MYVAERTCLFMLKPHFSQIQIHSHVRVNARAQTSPFNFVVFCLLYIILRSLFALNIWAIERYLFSSLANLGGKKFKFDAFESEQKEKEIER